MAASGVMKDSLIRGLSRQRESGEYCDVLITVKDDTKITVHSNVLAVSSIYFSDITREPSSLLPHIPSLRVGSYVSLSAIIQTGQIVTEVDRNDHVPHTVGATDINSRKMDMPIDFYCINTEVNQLQMDSVIFHEAEQAGSETTAGDDECPVALPTVLMKPEGHGLPIMHSSFIDLHDNLSAASFAGDDGDLITIDTSAICMVGDEKQPSPPSSSICSSTVQKPSRRGHKRSASYKYVFKFEPVDGGTVELARLAECVRLLVDFAYCCRELAVTDDTYPMLHELARLLQMEEAVSACEKHAVDTLVGEPAASESGRHSQAGSEPVESAMHAPPPAPDGSQLRVCRNCSFFCHGAARMREHRRMHHVRSYMCAQCGVSRQKTSQLLRHLIEADHGEAVCSLCFHECAPGERMVDHYLRHNDPRPFFCSVCFARFPSRTGLNLHMPTHSSVKPFVCHVCEQAFKWRHALQSHARTHGAEKQLLCDVCGFCTRHTGQFKAHRARHAGLTHACPHDGCPFRAGTPWLLKDHLVTHAADKQYQCEVCGKKFGHVRNMRRHALLHAQRRSLACGRCAYQTTRSDKLAQHERTKHAAAAMCEAGQPVPGDDDPAGAGEPVSGGQEEAGEEDATAGRQGVEKRAAYQEGKGAASAHRTVGESTDDSAGLKEATVERRRASIRRRRAASSPFRRRRKIARPNGDAVRPALADQGGTMDPPVAADQGDAPDPSVAVTSEEAGAIGHPVVVTMDRGGAVAEPVAVTVTVDQGSAVDRPVVVAVESSGAQLQAGRWFVPILPKTAESVRRALAGMRRRARVRRLLPKPGQEPAAANTDGDQPAG